jgi:putative ABC transport system ATP-binding protein
MLKVESAHVRFNQGTPNEVYALRGVSLELPAGSFATVVGSNGAGKSTLVNVISGSVKLTEGSVSINGAEVTRLPDFRRSRHVARVFADPLAGTVADMSIEDNVSLAMSRGRRRTLRFANGRAKRARIQEMLEGLGLGLENRLHENVGRLSSGQRQSLTLAMACARDPEILILDEHLSALDPVTRERLTDITMSAAAAAKCTTLMVTHSMEDAVRLGDHLIVMNGGRIVATFAGEEKATLTVDSLVDKIRSAGASLSDRSLLDAADA